MYTTKYATDLTGKTPKEVAEIIAEYRADDNALTGAAFDLLNSIEPWLKTLAYIPDLLDCLDKMFPERTADQMALTTDEDYLRAIEDHKKALSGQSVRR